MYILPALVALPLLALRTSAFLVPSSIGTLDNGNGKVKVTVVPEEENELRKSILATIPHVVALRCPECSFEGREGVENKIQLQFEASLSRGLVINGVPVLHSVFDRPNPISISAVQMSTEDGTISALQPLDFALERLQPISSQNEVAAIIPVRFTVLAIGGVPVQTDTVAVHMVRTEKELTLVRTDLIPFDQTPGAEACDVEKAWSWCRIKAILVTRMKEMMKKVNDHKDWAKGGCGGRFSGMGGPKGFGWMGGKRPGHHHAWNHGHRHWRAHRFGKVMHKTLRFFVIPALLGVIGGLMASAVGMLVGQILVYLWSNIYRRRERAAANARIVEIAVRADEKVGLMDEVIEDAPPVYTDVEVVVDEEKQ